MLNDIITAAYALGQLNKERNGKRYANGKAAAANTALGTLFDGAEHLNTAHARTLFFHAFVQGFDAVAAA